MLAVRPSYVPQYDPRDASPLCLRAQHVTPVAGACPVRGLVGFFKYELLCCTEGRLGAAEWRRVLRRAQDWAREGLERHLGGAAADPAAQASGGGGGASGGGAASEAALKDARSVYALGRARGNRRALCKPQCFVYAASRPPSH
jgi:hypothetical protein